MNTQDLLQANCERLLEQYHSNIEGLLTLQTTLIHDILPSITDELELGPEATEWARGWLEDIPSLFRISRRNNFTRSFAMEAIRKTLIWRLDHLWHLSPLSRIPILHCLPTTACDPLGRPILIIEALSSKAPDTFKSIIIQTFEHLRIHLKSLNDEEKFASRSPALQYIVLLDLKRFSFKNFDIELFTWTVREVIPRFPGMLAGVFMLNYSWAHAGAWSIIKHVLPASALSRVFFPSQEVLMRYFTPSKLPKDYGGSLPFLTHIEDPLWIHEAPLSIAPQGRAPTVLQDSMSNTITSIPPTSLLNPFFGYPASSTRGSPFLHHGRRRKRDLIRTLVILLWIRWHRRIIISLLITLCAITIKKGIWGNLTRLLARTSTWRALSFSRLGLK